MDLCNMDLDVTSHDKHVFSRELCMFSLYREGGGGETAA
jgi:hypothetical protein